MFQPQSREITDYLDLQIRMKLLESLQYLSEISELKLSAASIDVSAMLCEIKTHRQTPGVFARYFELVFALRNAQYEVAEDLLRDIAALVSITPQLEVKPLTREAMGPDAARYERLLNGNGANTLVAVPNLTYWNAFDMRVIEALDTLDATHAALAAEVRALVCEIIAAMPASRSNGFGGISSLALWGAVILRLDHHRTPLEIIESLVHEGAHILLFGYAAAQPLVTNASTERFESPLRKDPRPMDGVFHATFVCARLHLLYSALIERSDAAGQLDQALVRRRFDLRSKFFDGAQVVAMHAKLTNVGEKVIHHTMQYMTNAAA